MRTRRTPRLRALLSLLWATHAVFAQADIHVIVHASNPIESLSKKQVIDLFMGRTTNFPGDRLAVPLDRVPGQPARSRFYQVLTGKTEAQVDAYWATLIFAGRMTPPRQLDDQQLVIEAVTQNPNAIAYVESRQLPNTVKIVMSLPSPP